MSGGSLNYLYCKEPSQLFFYIEDIEQVEAFLMQKGYADIARDVRRLIEYIKSAENRIGVLSDQLNDVFHAVEWYISADYGPDTLADKLEKYRMGEVNT